MQKRGLSSIITTVLIILLSVAAVSAVWVFIIQPIVSNPEKLSPSLEACTSTQFKVESCQRVMTEASQEGYNVAYSLSSLSDKVESINSIRIILELDNDFKIGGLGDRFINSGEIKDAQLITDKIAKQSLIMAIMRIKDSNRIISCEYPPILCDNSENKTSQVDEDQQIAVPAENITDNITAQNSTCGNELIEYGEQCDGEDTLIGSIERWCNPDDQSAGIVTCNNNCMKNFSLCAQCGNNIIEGSEACEGSNLGIYSSSCNKYLIGGNYDPGVCPGEGCFASGQVSCMPSCNLDISNCN